MTATTTVVSITGTATTDATLSPFAATTDLSVELAAATNNQAQYIENTTRMKSCSTMEEIMKRIILAALISSFAIGSAMAQATCESQAVSKDGKPLSGAAKTSFIKKCKMEACEKTAVDKNGKALSGAAKTSHMTACEKGA